jgi:hypothetical protein
MPVSIDYFTRRTQSRILRFINNNTDSSIADLDSDTINLLNRTIRESVVNASSSYDSNNFALAYRQDIAGKVFRALRENNISVTSNFVANLSDDLEQLYSDTTMRNYRNAGTFDNISPDDVETPSETLERISPTTTDAIDEAIEAVESNVDTPEDIAARLNRFPEELDEMAKYLQEANPTDYPSIQDAKARIQKAIDEVFIRVKLDDALYPSIELKEVVPSGDMLVDFDELIPVLQKFCKEKMYTLNLLFDAGSNSNYFLDNESGMLQPSDQSKINQDFDFDYKNNQNTRRIIFPEDFAEVEKKLADLMNAHESSLSDSVRLGFLKNTDGSNGPLFTTAKTKHSRFEDALRIYRNPQVRAALDRAVGSMSFRFLGGGPVQQSYTSTSSRYGSTIHSLVVEKNGIGAFFKKVLAKPDGERYLELMKKQRYFMALEYVDVNGVSHIINIAEADHRVTADYSHSIGDVSDVVNNKKTGIATSFVTFDPQVTNGYYPNPMGDKVKTLKGLAVRNAVNWFRGLLAVADADGITLVQSPVNEYVADIYQLGEFLTENENAIVANPGGEVPGLQSSMIRFPNESNELVNGWMAKLANKEFKYKIEKTDYLWGSPTITSGIATKNKFTDITKSPRHKQLIALSKLIDRHSDMLNNPARRKQINVQMLNMALGGRWDEYKIIENMKDTLLNQNGYIFPKSDFNVISNLILENYEPKALMDLLFRTEGFVEATGINIMDVPGEVADELGITKASLSELGFDVEVRVDKDVISTGPLGKIDTGPGQLNIFNNLLMMSDVNLRPNFLEDMGIKYLPDVINELGSNIPDDADVDVNDTDSLNEYLKRKIENYVEVGEFEVDSTEVPLTESERLARGEDITQPATPEDRPVPEGSRQLQQRIGMWGVEGTFDDINDGSVILEETAGTYYPEGSYELDSMGSGRVTNYRSGNEQLKLLEELYEVENRGIIDNIFTQTTHGYDTSRNRLSDKSKHLFVKNLEWAIKNQLGTRTNENVLLAADIEFVGTESHRGDIMPVQYYEAGMIYTTTDADGTIKLHKDFTTIEVKSKRGATGNIVHHITSNISFGNTQTTIINTALVKMFKEQGIDIFPSATTRDYPSRVDSRMHPVGRVAYSMGVTDGTISDSNLSFGTREGDILRYTETTKTVDEIVEQTRFIDEELELQQQDRQVRRVPTDISPQPLYNQIDLDIMRVDVNETISDFFNLVDKNIDGAVRLQIKLPPAPGDEIPLFIDVTNRTNGVAEITRGQEGMSLRGIEFDGVKFSNLPDTAIVNYIELLAPDVDFYNGVVESNLKRIIPDLDSFGDSVINFKNQDLQTGTQYDIRQSYDTVLVNDDNLPRIYSNYSLSQYSTRDAGQFYGVPFNADRVPTNLNPDKKTLRQLGKAFAQTKTGKTLGYAWKAIDIGETLISKAFQQAQKTAIAAGAVGLGGVAATAATVWAIYEIGNLIVSAMQGIPELHNVFKKRNEILLNGEEWEKQIVEETFWQDYGPELLEILQEAGERSPSEILGNAIWSFTLDNLRRQSEGEVFEDALIDDSEEIDIRQDLWDAKVPDEYRVQLMQDNIDYDKVLTGYYNNRPDANAFVNRTIELANNVYNRDR